MDRAEGGGGFFVLMIEQQRPMKPFCPITELIIPYSGVQSLQNNLDH